MHVRVKKDSKVLAVTAFGGFQYIRAEWREVPPGSEEEAQKHPYLEIEPKAKIEVPVEMKAAVPEVAPKVKAPTKTKKAG
jgi:hypothetical protein